METRHLTLYTLAPRFRPIPLLYSPFLHTPFRSLFSLPSLPTILSFLLSLFWLFVTFFFGHLVSSEFLLSLSLFNSVCRCFYPPSTSLPIHPTPPHSFLHQSSVSPLLDFYRSRCYGWALKISYLLFISIILCPSGGDFLPIFFFFSYWLLNHVAIHGGFEYSQYLFMFENAYLYLYFFVHIVLLLPLHFLFFSFATSSFIQQLHCGRFFFFLLAFWVSNSHFSLCFCSSL